MRACDELRVQLGRFEAVVVTSPVQAQRIVVGVEIWHVRGATLQTRRQVRALNARHQHRASGPEPGARTGSAAAASVYRVLDFVTTL
jgi:hypothetical protein